MNRVLARLDSTRNRLLETIEPLDDDAFARRAAEGEWSVAEILHHLYLVEDRVIKELEKALRQEPRQLSLLRRLVPTSIVASRLIKVKAPKAMVPGESPERKRTLESLKATRSKLKELCETHGAQRLRQTIFKHPFLGEISGVATVSFVAYHEHRHYKQIREVLKKLAS